MKSLLAAILLCCALAGPVLAERPADEQIQAGEPAGPWQGPLRPGEKPPAPPKTLQEKVDNMKRGKSVRHPKRPMRKEMKPRASMFNRA